MKSGKKESEVLREALSEWYKLPKDSCGTFQRFVQLRASRLAKEGK